MPLTPILTIGAVILKDNQVLLVKHTQSAGHLTGTYGLPAAKVDPGEEPKEACVREIQEETGLTVKESDLVRIHQPFVANIRQKSGIKRLVWIVYTATKFTGLLQNSSETIPQWIPLDKIKEINTIKNVPQAIKLALREN